MGRLGTVGRLAKGGLAWVGWLGTVGRGRGREASLGWVGWLETVGGGRCARRTGEAIGDDGVGVGEAREQQRARRAVVLRQPVRHERVPLLEPRAALEPLRLVGVAAREQPRHLRRRRGRLPRGEAERVRERVGAQRDARAREQVAHLLLLGEHQVRHLDPHLGEPLLLGDVVLGGQPHRRAAGAAAAGEEHRVDARDDALLADALVVHRVPLARALCAVAHDAAGAARDRRLDRRGADGVEALLLLLVLLEELVEGKLTRRLVSAVLAAERPRQPLAAVALQSDVVDAALLVGQRQPNSQAGEHTAVARCRSVLDGRRARRAARADPRFGRHATGFLGALRNTFGSELCRDG